MVMNCDSKENTSDLHCYAAAEDYDGKDDALDENNNDVHERWKSLPWTCTSYCFHSHSLVQFTPVGVVTAVSYLTTMVHYRSDPFLEGQVLTILQPPTPCE
jgi:hypothetical protein